MKKAITLNTDGINMTYRADKFHVVAESEDLMTIQGEAQKYSDQVKKIKDPKDAANHVLLLYLQIAYDEGYRKVMRELKEDMSYMKDQINIVDRRVGWFEYIEDENTITDLMPLVRKRIASKRQRKAQEKHDLENGREFEEERFVWSMVIHTGFEQGYCKADSLEETAKIVCKDKERADLVMELFNEMLKQPEVKEFLDEQP